MARSQYIYIVAYEFDPDFYNSNEVIAAFTVKHEMVSWLKEREGSLEFLNIYRMDSAHEKTIYKVKELLNETKA